MAYNQRSSKKIFSRKRWRSRVTPRAKLTGARLSAVPTGSAGLRSARAARPASRARPRMRRGRLRLTRRATWTFVGLGVGLFLIILIIVLAGGEAQGGMIPRNGSRLTGSPIHIEMPVKGGVNSGDISILMDGQDLIDKAEFNDKGFLMDIALEDGDHLLEVKAGDKILAASAFSLDNTAPIMKVDSWDVREDGITAIAGTVDGAAGLLLDDKKMAINGDGSFQVEVNRYEKTTITLAAVDDFGNRREMLLDTSPPPQIRGSHVSIWVAADRSLYKKMIDLVKRTELNGLQIDVKDESGKIGYASQVPLAQETGSALTSGGMDLDRVMDKCWYNGIYPIARIVCFKDPVIASKRPDLAVKSTSGGRWGNGQWLDPYSREVWDYIVDIAVEAGNKGFKEIQLDYVRFPSDGDTSTCVFPANDGKNKDETIQGFLQYMRNALKPMGIVLSADVFGLTASDQGNMGIGQDIKGMAQYLDYISPMVYPSHYNTGEYNIKDPESNPHDIVFHSIEDFQAKLEGTSCKLRPWLQDFSLRVPYGANEVLAQMRACYELGVEEWLLWDPNCTFTETALQPAES
ncbi:MAG: hypothetical protein A2W01_00565 [Candidatus Solincola sediminis]|uniref:DUF4015 domain-containing protein n=1 Tax=Candidatus Solincola sediminis TaxID=1797199 RepID=A0A1F2WJ85_9ACTN|nr:MAG: hypothetical protein A2Y75_07040 [Candidatus Solincola sediminis]OFW60346.1 MAG: hypothetical protein A2W01_00565 [Candidatus Solincola sediminis]